MYIFSCKFLRLVSYCTLFLLFNSVAQARGIFLNGIDISGARSQSLQNVNLSINEKGDIFIQASHYQVHEIEKFAPIKEKQTSNLSTVVPQHKKPTKFSETSDVQITPHKKVELPTQKSENSSLGGDPMTDTLKSDTPPGATDPLEPKKGTKVNK